MKAYALRGREDWKRAPKWLKDRARECLGNKIAENEYEASRTIDATSKGAWDERYRFIPMPNVNHNGVAQGFFLPIREAVKGGADQVSFDVFLLVDKDNCLGFRFEPADLPNSSHGYCHVQMNVVMFRESMEVKGIPSWLPKSYPAFPIRVADPLQMFLSMAISIHGYGNDYTGGMASILQEVCKNNPRDAVMYINELKRILN